MSADDRWLVRVDTPMGHEILNAFRSRAQAMFFCVCCQEADPDSHYEVVESDWSLAERSKP